MRLSLLFYVVLWVAGFVGWIANIFKLCSMGMPVDVGHASVLFILRIVGIFVIPLGSVLGLFF